jgi:hypothetical protein
MFCRASRTIRFRGFERFQRAHLLHRLRKFTRLIRPLAQSPFCLGISRSVS